MVSKGIWSVVVGLGISLVGFLPALVWQYRRFGAPSSARLLGLVVCAVYCSAVVAYTLFPLPGPGELTPEFCAARGRPIEVDPTAHFRRMPAELTGLSLGQVATSWVVMQMVLNVALFVPLGVLGRLFCHWSAPVTVLTGLGVSVLVEATQYTGNWGLMPCSYRFADVNDLITNTTGTAVGVGLAALAPRMFADPEALEAMRHRARPVTRLRRWTAMVLDAWILAAAFVVTWVVVFTLIAALARESLMGRGLEGAPLEVMRWSIIVAVVAVTVLPALVGTRASLGQRIAYLRPVRDSHRPPASPFGRRLTPALLRGVVMVVLCGGPWYLGLLALLWLVIDGLWVAVDPRGLSGAVTGHDVVDARAVPRTRRDDQVDDPVPA